MKGERHITRRLSYHNYCSVKHNTLIIKQRSYCGNGAAYRGLLSVGPESEVKACFSALLREDMEPAFLDAIINKISD